MTDPETWKRAVRLSRRGGLLAGLVALVVAVAGCGLFTPAEPEPPDKGVVVRLPDLTVDPDSALYSMVQGLESKVIDLYIHGFADSQTTADQGFHAFFDFQDLEDYKRATGGDPPTDWLNQDERTFFPFFASRRPVSYDVILFPDPDRPDEFPDPGSDVIYFRKYRIWAVGDLVAHGVADFRIRRVGLNNEWKIVNWTDRRDTSATTVLTYGRWRLDSLSFQ